MDVARQHADRRRRLDPVPTRADAAQEARQAVERRPERRPVLEVDGSPQPLPEARHHPAVASRGDGLVPGLEVVQRPGQEPRDGGADDEVVVVAVLDLLLDPAELLLADHRVPAVGEDPAAPRVDDQEADPAEVAPERPHRALGPVGLAVRRLGEGPEDLLAVGDVPDGRERRVRAQQVGREVAEVLVDPVGHEGRGDPLRPPVGRLHVQAPGVGGVPVVADVVVVEDHRAREGRQEPADLGPAPRLRVQGGVLVVVDDLVARARAGLATAPDEPLHLLRRIVGIDLVAQHHDHVRPLLVRLARHPAGIHAQDVRVVAEVVLGLAARAEQDAHRASPGRGSGSGSADRRSRRGATPGRRRARPNRPSRSPARAPSRRRSRSGGRRPGTSGRTRSRPPRGR